MHMPGHLMYGVAWQHIKNPMVPISKTIRGVPRLAVKSEHHLQNHNTRRQKRYFGGSIVIFVTVRVAFARLLEAGRK
jgi:hypothetical protein